MLVLSRRPTDSIVIHTEDGSEISVHVLSVEKNGCVRLGINAPKKCKILRGELIEEVRDENKHAVAGSGALASLSHLNKLLPALISTSGSPSSKSPSPSSDSDPSSSTSTMPEQHSIGKES